MSVRYATLSTLWSGRGPKSSQAAPWFRRRAASRTTSYGTVSVTLGAVAHTKTAWVQAVASTSGAVGSIRLRVWSCYAIVASNATLLDIGVGAAGSEVVVVPNVSIGGATTNAYGGFFIDIPVAIASGARIAIRAQSGRTSFSFNTNVIPVAAADVQTTPSTVDVIGTSTANSGGTAMSGASGTYVQITASTSRDYQALIVVPSLAASGSAPAITAVFTLAVGAAGSERDITQCVLLSDSGLGLSNAPLFGDRGGGLIPAGSRIAVKHDIASTPGNLAVCVIGVPYV